MMLRPYQAECLDAIRKGVELGIRRQLVVLPTGSGKTVIFSHLLHHLDWPTMLVIAHREELLQQAMEKLRQAYPGVSIGLERADESAPPNSQIVVASKDTIGRKVSTKRLERFRPDQFSAVVVDEAHHSAAKTYTSILKYFRPELLLGVTATPKRGDAIPLANVYDAVVYSRTILDLVEEGEKDQKTGPYLCRFTGKKIKSSVDLRSLKVTAGDFNEGELAQAVNIDARNSLIISAVEQHAADRESILVFAVDRAHVEALAAQFRARGHSADLVLGNTPARERAERLAAFKDGNLRIMVSCGVLTEGFDNPRVDCLVMARPTMSPLLYMQMIGRGSRCFPGKSDCLILDVADTVGRFGVMDVGEAFGVRGVDFLGGDVIEKSKIMKKATELQIPFNDDDSIDDVEKKVDLIEKVAKGTISVQTQAQLVDLFSAVDHVVDREERDSIFPWVRINSERYILTMFDKTVVELERNALGLWGVSWGGHQDFINAPRSTPFTKADNFIKRKCPIELWMAKRSAAHWRQQPPTENQINTLRNRFRIMVLPRNLTKGTACDLLDYLIMQRKRTASGWGDQTRP